MTIRERLSLFHFLPKRLAMPMLAWAFDNTSIFAPTYDADDDLSHVPDGQYTSSSMTPTASSAER